jgi:superfamily II DNA or RNA helicase
VVDIVRIRKLDNVKLAIQCEAGISRELSDYFSFFANNYKFMPAYKNKQWDGRIKLYNKVSGTLPVGLYAYLLKFCKDRNYKVELVENEQIGYPEDKNAIDPDDLYEFIQGLNLHSRGNPIQVRDYQFASILKSLRNKRAVILSPTGSGKSLIIYIMLRWYLDHNEDKALVVVPTTSLVEQMYKDFDDYSSADDSFNSKDMCHMIYSGKPKTNIAQRVFISTWQSIYKFPRSWFDPFGHVVGDECHLFKAKSLSSLMNKCVSADYRHGLTGSLDGSDIHQLQLEGLFGQMFKLTTTKKLQDAGTLADLDIKTLVLKYPDSIRKFVADNSKTYHQEIDWLVQNEARNKFICNLALDQKGNTLLLFQFVEKHGKVLYDLIQKRALESRKVFFIHGEVEAEDREAIRHIVEKEDDAIIIASFGTFSTGINIRNLHNLIITSPSKSQIRILQSIGRSLRQSDNGQHSTLYDIVDDLSWGKRVNYAMKHGAERLKIYDKEGFRYNVYKVKIGDKK